MAVARNQYKVVFEDDRGNPQVAIGDRCSGAFQLNEQAGVLFGCFPAWRNNAHGRFTKKLVQEDLVASLLRSTQEAGFDFSEDDQREANFVAAVEPRHKFRIASKKIG
jgi:hypothetical protein